MEAQVRLISRLRREHRALLERLDAASPPRVGAPSKPTPAALRHLLRLVDELTRVLPTHFRAEECLDCKGLGGCGGAKKPEQHRCSDHHHGGGEHAELWQQVEGLARALPPTGAAVSPEAWGELRLRVDGLARALRAHLEHEEEDFHQRVEGAGRRARREVSRS